MATAIKGIDQREGVYRGKDGYLYLPGSRRLDGSFRKPVRVKEGYVPQEEQPIYETKGVKWSKDKTIPGLAPKDPVQVIAEEKAAIQAEKNRKKKERKKLRAEMKVEENPVNDVTEKVQKMKVAKVKAAEAPVPPATDETTAKPVKTPEEMSKKIRNLKKQLKRIEVLEEKLGKGEDLDEAQTRKLENKSEMIAEIARLEAALS